MNSRTRALTLVFLFSISIGGCRRKSAVFRDGIGGSFVALRSDETNVRAGPGKNFPIVHVYKLKHMPMRVTGEYDKWLKVVDLDGDSGWLSENLSLKIRTVITIKPEQFLYHNFDNIAYPTHRVEKNIVGRLLKCKKHRCKVKIGKITGWLDRSGIWGHGS